MGRFGGLDCGVAVASIRAGARNESMKLGHSRTFGTFFGGGVKVGSICAGAGAGMWRGVGFCGAFWTMGGWVLVRRIEFEAPMISSPF